jgi:hypothetical protein
MVNWTKQGDPLHASFGVIDEMTEALSIVLARMRGASKIRVAPAHMRFAGNMGTMTTPSFG